MNMGILATLITYLIGEQGIVITYVAVGKAAL